jgi:hypothetical protein
MVYYKQKYEGDRRKPVNQDEGQRPRGRREPPEGPRQPDRQGRQETGRRPERKRRQGPPSRPREEESDRVETQGTEKSSRRRRRGKTSQVPQGDSFKPSAGQKPETARPAEPKKGVLSRILGLFKKD